MSKAKKMFSIPCSVYKISIIPFRGQWPHIRVSIMFQFQRTMATNVCIKNVPITEDKATKGYVMIIFVDQLNNKKIYNKFG